MAGSDPIRVLLVDGDPEEADPAAAHLEREDDRFVVEVAIGVREGRDALAGADPEFDCVVSAHDVPAVDGIDFLETVRREYPNLPFVLFPDEGSETVASEAISAGVTDYLRKGSDTDQYAVLADRIATAVERERSRRGPDARKRELHGYERMVNSMREAACIYDEAGRFVLVNEYLADWYDTTRDALEGEPSTLISHVRARGEGDPYRELLDGDREELRGEFEGEFPGHGHAVVAYRLTPLTVEGSVEGVVGVARDVTERRERERELRHKTRAMDEAPVGITITDPAREDNPITYANEQFRRLTGYSDGEILGRNCRFLQGEGTDPEPVSRIREAIDAEERVAVELRNYRKDGSEFWNRVTISPVRDDDGTVVNYVGFQQDVSERKEYERELQRQNTRLDQFATVVSHDLRNPLSIASGRLELVREECDSDHLDGISDALDRMERIVGDMLWLAREDRDIGATDRVDLREAIEAAWVVAGEDAAGTDLVVATDDGDGIGTIEADFSRLRQLLENLFHNAVEHGGSDVTVTVGVLDDGFYVADDGPGIPADERDTVFDAGYSTTPEGTGFGLSIVEQVVEAHGWTITVTGGSDGGARFEITGTDRRE